MVAVVPKRLWRRNWGQITLSLEEDSGADGPPPAVTVALGARCELVVLAEVEAIPGDTAATPSRARAPPLQRAPCRRDEDDVVLPLDRDEAALPLAPPFGIAVDASSRPFFPWANASRV